MIKGIPATFAIIIMIFIYHLLNSESFETIKPKVKLLVIKGRGESALLDSGFLNTSNDIRLEAFDSSGLLGYALDVRDANNNIILQKDEVLLKKNKKIEITMPKLPELQEGSTITYSVRVRDWSNANFFSGNESRLTKKIIVKNNPIEDITIIASSDAIRYGGSAVIAFKIDSIHNNEDNKAVDKIFINNGFNDFKVYPYVNKHGTLVYIALIGWPISNSYFDPSIHVIDKAMNESVIRIPIQTNVSHEYRKFAMPLSNDALSSIVSKLDKSIFMQQKLDSNVDKFKFFNRFIRDMDNKKILNISLSHESKRITEREIKDFLAFNPIDDYKTSGMLGDEYIFRHNKESVGSYRRLSIDLLSKEKYIINTNDGFVAFRGNVGAYGNIAIINYNLGLSGLYGYLKNEPDISGDIADSEIIGISGRSGLAPAHGVSFATLIQGVFVNPKEWLDEDFINDNINRIIRAANNAK